uniref:Peptidase S1 domain-containing protein n=1 Tax=Zonotrichia albicollis TaxID=44394 RepID=A0A8D2NDD5_ZONAL
MSQQCPGSQEGHSCAEVHQAQHHQPGEGGDCPALLCTGAASPRVMGVRVYMGSHTINEKSNHVAMRLTIRIIVYPEHDQAISDYDIALLEMETAVLFSELVEPICLPSTSRVFLYGTVCYVGGLLFYGHLAKTLQEAQVGMINQSVCNKLYDDLTTSRMLCAGNLNGGVHAYSGGPLAWTGKGNRWYLAGIMSWGEGCAWRNCPGVYTKVTGLYDWICELHKEKIGVVGQGENTLSFWQEKGLVL